MLDGDKKETGLHSVKPSVLNEVLGGLHHPVDMWEQVTRYGTRVPGRGKSIFNVLQGRWHPKGSIPLARERLSISRSTQL